MNAQTKTASAYLILVPEIYSYGQTRYVRSVRVDRVRSNKPALARGEIAVKVSLRFQESALLDSIPEVTVDVTNFAVGQDAPEVEVAA